MKQLQYAVTAFLLIVLSTPSTVVYGDDTEIVAVSTTEAIENTTEIIQAPEEQPVQSVAVPAETPLAESDLPVEAPTIATPQEEPATVQEDISKSPLSEEQPNPHEEYVTGEVLVKFKESKIDLETTKGKKAAYNFASAYALRKTDEVVTANVSVLSIKDADSVEEKIDELEKNPNVEYVQPNYQYYPAAIGSNDPFRGALWGLDNTGQRMNNYYIKNDPGIPDRDIDIQGAWLINPGTTSPTIVAVIDDGVAYNHPDLASNMWDGSLCKDAQGVFLGGCIHGYDYTDGDKTPLPTESSHGTHIAGTIAAVRNNATGIVGVAPYAKIMAIRTSFTTLDNVRSIQFATQNGAKVINASWVCYTEPDQGGSHITCGTHGGDSYNFGDQLLADAIANFPGIFVTAAGNGTGDADDAGDDHEARHAYPCDLPLPNIICTTATDQSDVIADFADFGNASVDVGAPGVNIYSTIADRIVLAENFESVVAPALPNNWTHGGTHDTWGVYGFDLDQVLFTDLGVPYTDDVSSFVQTPAVNLTGANTATISFTTQCDTEYTPLRDYVELLSYDGISYISLGKWDEVSLDDDTNETGASPTRGLSFELPMAHLLSTTQFEFRWKTDAHDPSDAEHEGCFIDDLEVQAVSDGSDNRYGFMTGTSMSAGYVAGTAALLMGYGTGLSTTEVKDIIVHSGDIATSLSAKTVSGKRINAQNALTDTTPPVITLIGSNPLQLTTGALFSDPGATAFDNFDGATTTTATNTVTTAVAGTYTITYTARDRARNVATTTRTVVVSDAVADVTPPTITLIGASTINLKIGSTETIPGATAFDVVDGDRTSFIVVTDTVDKATPGTYTITYTVGDVAGNIASTTRTVIVESVSSGSSNSGGGSSGSGGGGGGGGGGSSKKDKEVYTVAIAKGAEVTNASEVTLTFTAPKGTKQMKISNTSRFSSEWLPYTKNYTWTLTPGSGKKTVYVRFGANNKVLGDAKDSITFTESAPSTRPQSSSPTSNIPQAPSPTPTVSANTTLFNFARTLSLGTRGQDVTELQKILISGKYLHTGATGYYGELTRSAVRAYQRANNLPTTGIVDTATLALLNTRTTPITTPPQGNTAIIATLQAKLAELIAQLQNLKRK